MLPDPVNSKYFECDGKITSDGKAMIFVSDRPGGIGEFKEYGKFFNGAKNGNTDIYVSQKTDSGWSKPINLGKIINTPFAERKPFLHPDGKSLYFSSDGHPGLGRLDLFKSTRLKEDSWTEWSEPINLGKEINSGRNDRGAIVATSGELAYFATADRGLSFGGTDIYKMDVPARFKPEPVTTLSGRVLDNKGNILEAKIVWEDLETGKKLGELRSNPDDGKFFIILPQGKNYGVYAEKEGYFPISKNIDLRKIKDGQKIKEDIVLYSISDLIGDDLELMGSGDLTYDSFELKEKKLLQMNNLFFEYNKATLLKSSFSELDRVIYLLKNYPIDLVEVAGHSDSVGNEEYNISLSDKRAQAVRDYIIKKGIGKDKLVSKGYGKHEPIASNETEEGRKQNRRVELRILKISRVRK
jgi:outer membrane protein OmpA-like peptidoglycan-associated protein